MIRKLFPALALLVTSLTVGAQPAEDQTTTQGQNPLVEHGRYLVHDVAMCVQCHSPRNRQGELKMDRLLTGGAVPVTNPYEGARWAFQAPNIRQVLGYSEAEFLRLMQTGIRRDGTRPRLPMPPFRMTEEDARAVYLYLKTQ